MSLLRIAVLDTVTRRLPPSFQPLALGGRRLLPRRLRPCPAPAVAASPMDPVGLRGPQIPSTSRSTSPREVVSAMCRLSHPNVLRLHEVLATGSKVYLVMDLAIGGDLLSRLASLPSRRLPEHTARRVFLKLTSALIYSHARGVFHRDMKPQNVLLNAEGNLEVSDFRLAALPDSVRDDRRLHTACGT